MATGANLKYGDWVLLERLKTASHLNGRYALVSGRPTKQPDGQLRIPVLPLGLADNTTRTPILVKPENTCQLPKEYLRGGVRLHARGETINLATPISIPKDLGRHLQAGNSPVMARAGFPIIVEKVAVLDDFDKECVGPMDNQRAAFVMIDPTTGFAPIVEWGKDTGPVIVYRPGVAETWIDEEDMELSVEDMEVVTEWTSELLDFYPEESKAVVPHRDLTPKKFYEFMQRYKKKVVQMGRSPLRNLHFKLKTLATISEKEREQHYAAQVARVMVGSQES
eukprot:Plantae.Rhodophyta-Hildenbrandia_rubra.ctg15049.p1 GENE.Plantae.Rhodophyta-Hildenbrandia_rubra.ctg15049~~Plantae.Rhodophyta-Hildenbrandia_rubra.ctg15049.p1  ORF type:complete len:280 (+),score=49.85 Plantae.Rhodophyta-Hildenbrandia_rubra.ctg15049:586-1425(+)